MNVIFVTTLECGELAYPLSIDMQGFQIWYLASYPEKIGYDAEPARKLRLAFPCLQLLPRETRLIRGAEFIEKLKAARAEGHHAVQPAHRTNAGTYLLALRGYIRGWCRSCVTLGRSRHPLSIQPIRSLSCFSPPEYAAPESLRGKPHAIRYAALAAQQPSV